jgi:hypothetical protein
MLPILHHLGADPQHADDFCSMSANLPKDPVWGKIRSIQNGRLALHMDSSQAHRLSHAPFQLGRNDVMSEDISDVPRRFGEIPEALMANSTFQALARLLSMLIPQGGQVVSGSCANSRTWHANFFPIRIRTKPSLIGDPTPEGVHSDGCELNMAMLLGKHNVHEQAATTRIYSLRQRKGCKVGANEASEHEIFRCTMQEPFETVLLLDRFVLHDVTPVLPCNPAEAAHRDVLIGFVRRPLQDTQKDPTEQHSKMPCTFSLDAPVPVAPSLSSVASHL